jgi:predicted permease
MIPSAVRRFLLRVLTLFRSGRAEQELAREIEAHLRLLEDKFIARGMSATDARYAARREFGGVEQIKEHQRDTRTFRWLAGWPTDLKLGARMLVKSPGITVVAVVALAIAIGGGIGYLEVINGHFRPSSLPLPDGDRIVGIQNWDIAADGPHARSLKDFALWRETVRSIEHLGAYAPLERNLVTDDGRAELVRGVAISPSAFRLAPTPPLVGRPLVADDEQPNAAPVVLLGYNVWQSRFAGDYGVVGRTVRLGNTAHTIVGVMPHGFGFPVNYQLWVPLRVETAGLRRGEGPEIKIFGRLAAGAAIESAQAELTSVTMSAAAAAPDSNQNLRPQVKPYVESLQATDPEGPAAQMILYAANFFFIALIAVCGANVATLVFARTATREGEITIRTALGASRGRIVAQLFAEALVLTSVAAVVGIGAAAFAIRAVTSWVTAQSGQPVPFWWDENLETATLVYAGALAVFAAAIIGIVPAFKATRFEMHMRLKEAGATGGGMKFGKVWTGVIVAQVALTVVFLLSVVTLGWNAYAGSKGMEDLIFTPTEYLTMSMEMDRERPSSAGAAADTELRTRFVNYYRDIEREIERQAGVAGVTYASKLPGMGQSEFWVELDGMEPATRPADGPLWVRSAAVAPDFFDTFGSSLVAGRRFSSVEAEQERPVAIVDESFVRLILGGRNPIGLRIREPRKDTTTEPGPWLEIVGVTKDLSTAAGKTTEDAMLFRPTVPGGSAPLHLIVHARGDANAWAGKVRDVAVSGDASLRLKNIKSLHDHHRAEAANYEIFARLLSVASAVALLLATAGVYALMSFTLARRTREIAIRVALGAAPKRIIGAIFSRAFAQVGLGVLVGSIPGAALVALGAPEVARGGGPILALLATGAVAFLIAVIALFACFVPARKALRVHPMDALRADA